MTVLCQGDNHLGRFGLKEQTYPMSSLSYDLRKLKGHGLVERDRGRYRYRLTEKGQRAAVLFLMFHQRLCGPLAGSQFGHRPNELHRPKISKLEQAYNEADRAIDKIVTMLKAA
jgi:DNA-binding HxlR family transcriptional regulator